MSLPAALIDAFREIPVTTVFEGQGRTGAMVPAVKPLDRLSRICGPAATVRCAPYDNLALHQAIAGARPGEILVVETSQAYDGVLFGEILAAAALAHQVVGIVLDGHVRDSAGIRSLGFPTFCRGVAIRGSSKVDEGSRNVPVVCGGIAVDPGDLVVGDADGVVVVPARRAQEVLERTRQRMEQEERLMVGVRKGRSTLELLGLLKEEE